MKIHVIKWYKSFHIPLLFISFFSGITVSKAQVDIVLNQPITGPATYTATHSITLNPGFSVNGANGAFSASISITSCPQISLAPSLNQNHVLTVKPRTGITDASAFNGHTICDLMESIQYFDGLGRPTQMVQVKGNPDATKDIIQPIGYDGFGRESKKYLPYIDGTNPVGAYRADALQPSAGQAAFYNNPSVGVATISSPFSETAYDSSPLNREVAIGAPGATWQLTSGHASNIGYLVNDPADVYLYDALPGTTAGEEYKTTLSPVDYYVSGDLYLTVTKDENWVSSNGKIGTKEEYTDKEGRVVLRRTYNTNSEKLSTYYVYDYKGNLSFVLPPAVNPDAGNVSQAVLDNFCYQYRYDGRNRLIEKKIPGKDWEYFVYNMHDQLVMSQDREQRNNNKWTFAKYDLLGRPIITGLCNSSASRSSQQNTVNQQSALGESSNTSSTGYSDLIYPTQVILDHYLIITYYDNYTWPGANTLLASGSYSTGLYNKTTGIKTYTIDGAASYLTANYYDIEGRLVETVGQNHLGGTDRIVNTYNNITGDLLTSNKTHIVNGATTTEAKTYVYDHMSRPRQLSVKVNSGPNVVLSQVDYNDIGQPMIKHLHSTDGGGSFLQNIKYAYNERGWLRTLNSNNASSTNNLFSEELRYNAPDNGITPQYNGNIAQMLYTGIKSGNQAFSYTYDPLDRLISAKSTSATLDETITYDNLGNISSLQRTGPSAANLAYNYVDANNNLSNQLQSVKNNGNALRNYTYDGNGNAKSDGGNKTIVYNILDLPQTITQNNVTIASYVYDASGNKLKNTGSDGVWDYMDGFVYKNNLLSFIITEEGRLVRNPSDGSFNYEYNIQDHLGNVRVSFDKGPDGNARVIQEDQYYSFGLRKPGGYDFSNNNRYLYNGKEIQTDLVNQYDYGARFYDPVIARWTNVDPLAEMSRRFSPYNYGLNNPVRFIDPDGMGVTDGKGGEEYITDWVRLADGTAFYDGSVNSQADVTKKYGAGALDVSNQTWSTSRDGLSVHFNKDNSWNFVTAQPKLPFEQTWEGFQAGIRANMPMLDAAQGVSIASTMVMSGGLGAGEVGGNFLINGVGRKADFLSTLAENTSSIGKWSQLTGAAGEEAVGISGVKTAIDVGGRTRIPDRLTANTLEEVKNVKYQGLTKQLRDFYQYSKTNGLEMILHTRSNTIISKPLQNLIDNGFITHKIIPGL